MLNAALLLIEDPSAVQCICCNLPKGLLRKCYCPHPIGSSRTMTELLYFRRDNTDLTALKAKLMQAWWCDLAPNPLVVLH